MALFGRQTERDQQRAQQWRDWLRRQHPLAIASLILGIISIIEFGVLLVFGVAGIVLGAVAIVQIRQRPAELSGRRLAWWGIALSAASLLIAVRFAYQWV